MNPRHIAAEPPGAADYLGARYARGRMAIIIRSRSGHGQPLSNPTPWNVVNSQTSSTARLDIPYRRASDF